MYTKVVLASFRLSNCDKMPLALPPLNLYIGGGVRSTKNSMRGYTRLVSAEPVIDRRETRMKLFIDSTKRRGHFTDVVAMIKPAWCWVSVNWHAIVSFVVLKSFDVIDGS